MTRQQKNGSIIAIIAMMYLYAMIGFVTNLAAPIGNVMKYDPEVGNNNFLAMMGNLESYSLNMDTRKPHYLESCLDSLASWYSLFLASKHLKVIPITLST